MFEFKREWVGLNYSVCLLIAVPSYGIFYFKWAIISLYYGYITKRDSVSFHIAAAKQGCKTEFSHGGTGGIACMKICIIEGRTD